MECLGFTEPRSLTKNSFVQLALAAPWSSEDLVLGPVVSWESWTKGSRGSAELRCIWSCLCRDLAVLDALGRFDLRGVQGYIS